jgi:hypothetical protein
MRRFSIKSGLEMIQKHNFQFISEVLSQLSFAYLSILRSQLIYVRNSNFMFLGSLHLSGVPLSYFDVNGRFYF